MGKHHSPSIDGFGKSPPRNNEQSFDKPVIVLIDDWVKRQNIKHYQKPFIFVDFARLFLSETRMLDFDGQE